MLIMSFAVLGHVGCCMTLWWGGRDPQWEEANFLGGANQTMQCRPNIQEECITAVWM